MTLRVGTRRLSGPLAVVLACILPVISCGGANSSAENPPEASPADAEVFFEAEAPGDGLQLAHPWQAGRRRRGLPAHARPGTTLPLWPPKHTLDTKGDAIRVRDAGGETVARLGERTTLGGGGAGDSMVRNDGLVNDRTERELFERCPGVYFLVQGI